MPEELINNIEPSVYSVTLCVCILYVCVGGAVGVWVNMRHDMVKFGCSEEFFKKL